MLYISDIISFTTDSSSLVFLQHFFFQKKSTEIPSESQDIVGINKSAMMMVLVGNPRLSRPQGLHWDEDEGTLFEVTYMWKNLCWMKSIMFINY